MRHPRPFYYLDNFTTALRWLGQRYADLLNDSERGFLERVSRLPVASSALLVRMSGRRGDLFRTGKLQYEEIGCVRAAAAPLIEVGWVDCEPILTVAELGWVLRKGELQRALACGVAHSFTDVGRTAGVGVHIGAGTHAAVCIGVRGGLDASMAVDVGVRGGADAGASAAGLGVPLARCVRKADLLMRVEAVSPAPQRLIDWWSDAPDIILRVTVKSLCDRLWLLFFGNFHQDWSEFVLTDLGIFKYEQVAFDTARAFQSRQHIDTFYALFECQQRLEDGDDLAGVVASLPPPIADNERLEGRRCKLQFRIAQRHEQPPSHSPPRRRWACRKCSVSRCFRPRRAT
jgi:hypothetical protein